MFHKEGAQSILLGIVFTAVVLLLSDKFIELNWLKMAIQISTLVLLINLLFYNFLETQNEPYYQMKSKLSLR